MEFGGSVMASSTMIGKCPACGRETGGNKSFEKHGLRVERCRDCELLFVNPQPDEEEVARIYNKDYFNSSGFHCYGYKNYDRLLGLKRFTFRRWIRELQEYCPPATLLEVGCAEGAMMEIAAREGWDVRGIDISEYAIEKARGKGLNVTCGRLDENIFGAMKYHAILMLDVLEHVPSPLDLLSIARRMLLPGGVIFIITPNSGSLSARIQGMNWPHLKPTEHLFLFSKPAMRHMLEKAGFNTEKIITSRKVMTIDHLIADLGESNPALVKALDLFTKVVPLRHKQFYMPLGELCAIARRAD